MRLPLPSPARTRVSTLAFLLLFASGPAAADDTIGTGLASSLRPLESLSRTGVILDRVLPLAGIETLDGRPASPVVDGARWRQAYDELRRASIAPSPWPELAVLDAGARDAQRSGVIPLALFDRAFERVRPDAIADGSLRVADGAVTPGEAGAAAPLIASRAFAMASLAPRTWRGADVAFALAASRIFADTPGALEIDLADGAGFRPVVPGERLRAHYASTGTRTLTARRTRDDGSIAESHFAFEVVALATPSPNDTLHVSATIPWSGQFGTGDAYVYLASGRTAIANPVVVIEGFDLDNSMNWDELYALLDQQNLIETLRADGFDAIVLNFTDATDAIQKNAFVVEALIEQVQSLMPPEATIGLVGASMGGLCSRYALAYMETHGLPHRVRTWISFDSPQAGANIPLGLQYWINFFAAQSTDAGAFLAILQRPAARQMLLYHFTTPPTATGQADPMRATLNSDLASVGSWPTQPRRVAIANGSGASANQGFLPGDQLIRWEYTSLFVDVTGNVFAVPDQTSHAIFNGRTRALFTTTTQNVSVAGTLPWDGAPGGSRTSLDELAAVPAPYGDIVALHPAHCFIPTISSLGVSTTNPFFDVDGTPGLLALTPFDAVYFPSANQDHVLITAENAVWVKQEIESGVVSAPVAGGEAPARETRISAGPNPAAGPVRLEFSLPRAGRTRLAIFGVDGREVRRVFDEPREAGLQSAAWDGRDQRGTDAPAGVYFARLTVGANSIVTRLARLR